MKKNKQQMPELPPNWEELKKFDPVAAFSIEALRARAKVLDEYAGRMKRRHPPWIQWGLRMFLSGCIIAVVWQAWQLVSLVLM